MIKIAVVDDDPRDRETLAEHFRRLSGEDGQKIQLALFSSGEELLSRMDGSCDLICLDIDLKGELDGMETARRIRQRDQIVTIVFITNMAQMAVAGYEVHAYDFIVKPVSYYTFALKMKGALRLAERQKERTLILSTPDGLEKMPLRDLYYVETDGHYLCFHTARGILRQKSSMRDLVQKLKEPSFALCSQSYLVNLEHVSAVSKEDVRVKAEWLRMSRPKKKAFLAALTDYLGGGL